jgi:Holliday junction resolvase RusA-like endonuclease
MIHMVVPSVPPSMNHAYENKPRKVKVGGRFQTKHIRMLSEEGRAYKIATSTHLVRAYPTEMQVFKKNRPFALFLCFVFPQEALLVKGYPAKSDNRYKKLDVGNRLKLFEDALTEATGIDDSHNWLVALTKRTGPEEATHIWVWDMEHEPGPFGHSAESLLSIAQV